MAAAGGDTERVRALLDAEPQLVHLSDRAADTPLHRAVAVSAREVVKLLLDRGADLHALHGAGPGSERGYAAVGRRLLRARGANERFRRQPPGCGAASGAWRGSEQLHRFIRQRQLRRPDP